LRANGTTLFPVPQNAVLRVLLRPCSKFHLRSCRRFTYPRFSDGDGAAEFYLSIGGDVGELRKLIHRIQFSFSPAGSLCQSLSKLANGCPLRRLPSFVAIGSRLLKRRLKNRENGGILRRVKSLRRY